MRISEQAKEETRKRIVATAAELFTGKGFEDTTTRDIAQAAGLATGTLFNYFPTKEALAMTMVNQALTLGRTDYHHRRTGDEGLAEELFLFISSGLRRLKPLRPFIGPALERSLSPFARKSLCLEGETTKTEHLRVVHQIIARHSDRRTFAAPANTPPERAAPATTPAEPSPTPQPSELIMAVNLYWSLYLGILAFWSNDDSENQSETLALLDYSLTLYAITLADTGNQKGERQ